MVANVSGGLAARINCVRKFSAMDIETEDERLDKKALHFGNSKMAQNFRVFLSYSSVHGLSRIGASKSKAAKALWAICVAASLGRFIILLSVGVVGIMECR